MTRQMALPFRRSDRTGRSPAASCVRAILTLATYAAVACSDSTAPRVPRDPIVFNSNASGAWDIYLIGADGSGLRNLTTSPEDDLYPVWSPDHRLIAYFSQHPPSGLWVMNADGSGKRSVLAGWDIQHVGWSPDGKRILFAGSGSGGVLEYHSVNLDGTALQWLSYNPNGGFSPDGRLVTYAAGLDIWVMDTTTKIATNLTNSSGSDENDPQFSRDGRQIVYASNATGPTGVWLMNADGTGQHPLAVALGHYDRDPRWSSDGTRIVFQRTDETGLQPVTDIYIMSADGSNLHPVSTMIGSQPSW
jgi:Tol biopolymer transport system component